MKIADLSVKDLSRLVQNSVEAAIDLKVPGMISAAVLQSESRVIELLCDRMDEGFAEIRQEMTTEFHAVRQEMNSGFKGVYKAMSDRFDGVGEAVSSLGNLIDCDHQDTHKRLTKLEHKVA